MWSVIRLTTRNYLKNLRDMPTFTIAKFSRLV